MSTCAVTYRFPPNSETQSRKVNVNFDDLVEYINNAIPTGEIRMYGGAAAPTGWLLCDGSAVSRTTYSELFAVLSTTFGTGDGSTTFNLPDFRGIFPKGAGTTTRAAGVDASGNAYAGTLGTYLQDKMQGHKHDITAQTIGIAAGVGTTPAATTTGNAAQIVNGSPTDDGTNGTPRTGHTTEPQSLGISFIIRY